jgi:hypothetical protein
MHVDPTLHILDETTSRLGTQFRKFAKETCPAFNTQELKREADARKRRKAKKAKKAKASKRSEDLVSSHASPEPEPEPELEGSRPKNFSLQTYKFHALGDYVETIRRYGTTDSFSTEPVSSLPAIQLLF